MAAIEVNRAKIARIVQPADMREKLLSSDVEPMGDTPEQLAEVIRDGIPRYGPVVNTANIKAE